MASRWSSSGHGSARCIAVPGLGRKFWTITSCTCPWRRWASAMASSAASRSARSSPMPTRMPVVNGMPRRPAASRVARRRSGSLSGAPWWAARSARSVSTIIPWLGATGRRAASSSSNRAPALAWGSRPVSVEHQAAHGRQVVDRGRVPVLGQPLGRGRVALFGPFAEGEQRLVAPRGGPGPGDRQHLVGRQVGRREPGGRLGERAVPTPVATQHRQRDEDLGRIGDPGAGGGVAHPARLTHQHVERQVEQVGVPHPRRDYRRAGTTLTGAAPGRGAAEPRGVLVRPARRPRRPARRRAGRRSPSARRGLGAPRCPRRASGPPRRPPAGRSRTRPGP